MPRYFLVAGVDFGTSFSKVVLREQNTGEAEVVSFVKHPEGLLNSLVGINKDRLVPPGAVGDYPCVPYLKMLAAHAANGTALNKGPIHVPAALGPMRETGDLKVIRALLAFYFAHIMAGTESFIRKRSLWRHFDKERDLLIFQLAVPTGLLDNDGDTERLFRKTFIAAYELRNTVDPAMVDQHSYFKWSEQVEEILSVGLPSLQKKHEWQCLDYPEVLAAMQTLFRSPNQKDGRYITMDVGAGTVELNAFYRNTGENLQAEERAKAKMSHDYYAMKVCPLGIHNLHDSHELVWPLKTKQELAKGLRDEISNLFYRAKEKQPNHRNVAGQRTWDRARFLIFGGGAHIAPYRDTFRDTLNELGIHFPRVFDLPAAQDLVPPEGVSFGRFAVAYGMSFFRKNLDEWRPPGDIMPFNKLYPPDPSPPPNYMSWDD